MRRAGVAVVLLGALLMLGRTGEPRPARAAGDDLGTQALAAARLIVGPEPGDCMPDDPPGTPRVITGERFQGISAEQWKTSVARGVAVFNALFCQDSGARLVLGRTPDGVWQFWAGGSARVVQQYVLPGEMIACTEGAGLRVRATPEESAALVATLPGMTPVTGEEFLLTEPDAYLPRVSGVGWYRLSAPVAGWVYSRPLLTTDLPDCSGLPLVP